LLERERIMECRMEDLPKRISNEKRIRFEYEIEYIQKKIEKTGAKFSERQRQDWEDLIIYRKMALGIESILDSSCVNKAEGKTLNDAVKEAFNLISAYEKTSRQVARRLKNMPKEQEALRQWFLNRPTSYDYAAIMNDRILHNHPCCDHSEPLQSLPQLQLVENTPLTHINWCLPRPDDDPDDLYA